MLLLSGPELSDIIITIDVWVGECVGELLLSVVLVMPVLVVLLGLELMYGSNVSAPALAAAAASVVVGVDAGAVSDTSSADLAFGIAFNP